MKKLIVLLLALALPGAIFAQAKQPRKVFPYAYSVDDFPNGLRLITVPTDYPNLVALYFVVQTGSRNEIEPGKSCYAHFFEHLMFRGSQNFTSAQRIPTLTRPAIARFITRYFRKKTSRRLWNSRQIAFSV